MSIPTQSHQPFFGAIVKDTSTDLQGSCLLQNDFKNTVDEIRPKPTLPDPATEPQINASFACMQPHPSEREQLVMFNCYDLNHASLDSGERQ